MKQKNDLKKFGLTFGLSLTGLALLFYILQKAGAYYFGAAGLCVLFLAFAAPKALSPIHRLAMYLVGIITKFITLAVLAICYYVVFAPWGFFLRITGISGLDMKFDRTSKSYWRQRVSKTTVENYKNQY